MKELKNHNDKLTFFSGNIPLESLYTVGIAGDKFFQSLKNIGALLSSKCSRCNYVYVPCRLFCERCFDELKEYKELEPVGAVYSFSEVNIERDGSPVKTPVQAALIKINGADSLFYHRLNVKKPKIGMKVKAVLEKYRKGSINDIRYFEEI
ncbi:MAG: Zn-ribbon domain-containing OB-fold protein [Planctomycetes bacterium]|nr:Zn-ribbon domain-containing OB-fold protein [Planctomycetota bacterium]